MNAHQIIRIPMPGRKYLIRIILSVIPSSFLSLSRTHTLISNQQQTNNSGWRVSYLNTASVSPPSRSLSLCLSFSLLRNQATSRRSNFPTQSQIPKQKKIKFKKKTRTHTTSSPSSLSLYFPPSLGASFLIALTSLTLLKNPRQQAVRWWRRPFSLLAGINSLVRRVNIRRTTRIPLLSVMKFGGDTFVHSESSVSWMNNSFDQFILLFDSGEWCEQLGTNFEIYPCGSFFLLLIIFGFYYYYYFFKKICLWCSDWRCEFEREARVRACSCWWGTMTMTALFFP